MTLNNYFENITARCWGFLIRVRIQLHRRRSKSEVNERDAAGKDNKIPQKSSPPRYQVRQWNIEIHLTVKLCFFGGRGSFNSVQMERRAKSYFVLVAKFLNDLSINQLRERSIEACSGYIASILRLSKTTKLNRAQWSCKKSTLWKYPSKMLSSWLKILRRGAIFVERINNAINSSRGFFFRSSFCRLSRNTDASLIMRYIKFHGTVGPQCDKLFPIQTDLMSLAIRI